jgi:hypothetical protein
LAKIEGELEVGVVIFTLKEKLFFMMLANGDLNINHPVKQDLIEWVNLILDANK